MRRFIIVLGFVGAVVWSTGAGAAPGWVPDADRVAPPASLRTPVAVVTPDRRTVAVWVSGLGVSAAVRPRGGMFGEPFVVDPGSPSFVPVSLAAVALPNGDVLVASSGPNSSSTAEVKLIRSDGTVAQARAEQPGFLSAIDANASGAVAFAYFDASLGFVVAIRPAGADTFNAPITLQTLVFGEIPGDVDVVLHDDGRVAVAIGIDVTNPPAGTARVVIARVVNGATTVEQLDSRTLNLTPPMGQTESAAYRAEIEPLADGRELLAYRREQIAFNGNYTRALLVGPQNGTPPDPFSELDVGGTGGLVFGRKEHGLVVDETGRPFLWWQRGTGRQLRVNRGTIAGALAEVNTEVLTTTTTPAVAAAPFGTGRTGVLYLEQGVVRARTSEAGGAFGPAQIVATPTAVATNFEAVGLAGAGEGSGVGLWLDGPALASSALDATPFDATPPSAPALQLPAALTAGIAGTFAATASDDWSVPSLSWQFGDGGSGAGGSVTRAYSGPGAFGVTATATDAVGNTASTAQGVTVAPASDTRAPVLSVVRLIPATLVRPRLSTLLRFRLNEAATVVAQLERARPGFRSGGRCVARRPVIGPIRRCTRWVRVGAPIRRAKPVGVGALAIRRPAFTGRYRVAVFARDAAGNRSPIQRRALVVR